MSDTLDLQQLKRWLAAATPNLPQRDMDDATLVRNRAYIIAAVNSLPALIAIAEEVEDLRAENRTLRQRLTPDWIIADAIAHATPEIEAAERERIAKHFDHPGAYQDVARIIRNLKDSKP